jgi:glucose/arabinose dehydrogenase/fibronectin type 3 domain-containing protein
LLVTTQFGTVRIVQNGSLLPGAALDLGTVVCTDNERGLLGAAVDPSFASNGFVYLYYTRNKSGTCVNRVSRFTMSGSTIAIGTESVLVDEIPTPSGNHNGGDVRFGKDGYLYISVGDGACDYAGGGCYGQNDASRDQHALIGKILRITSTGGIPPTNPFQGAGTARCNVTGRTTSGNKCQETFAWGFRNPFRIAFDPNTTATRFFVNDVGEGTWEEVDEGQAGADYGWNVREGPCVNGSTSNCGAPPAGMTNPIYAYSHGESTCHAITGGAFVPNGVWPASFDGTYLYGDYTCGKVFVLTPNGSGGYTRSEFANDVGAVVNMTFGPSPQGQGLYYTNYDGGGQVRRIESTASSNRAPTASVTAAPTSGAVPLAVSFNGSASTDPDTGDTLTYIWDFGDGSQVATTTSPTTSHTYTTAGTFTATLTVRDNHGSVSPAAQARIDPGNTAPQVTINTPTVSDRFAVGQAITLHATATDAEDGTLPSARLSWVVLRHHDAHTHPFLAPTAGNDIQITQPAPEDLGSGINGYLEIQLTATDSAGVSTTVTRDVQPNRVNVTFSTTPAGRDVVVAGTTYTAPTTLTSWQGYGIAVDARTQTDGSGNTWNFQTWSDGGAAAHTIVTPAAPATYTATFVQSSGPAGLVAAYGFDAGSGTTAADSSGKGNAGSVSGPVWSAVGRFGSALSFDGVNDWVSVPDAGSLDLTNGMTLEAWVRPSALGGWRTVAFKERTGGVVYGLFADQAGSRPLGQVFIGAERNAIGTAALPLNAWTHLASTFDGSTVRLFVNGVLAGSSSVSGAMAASTGVLHIGGNSVWGEWYAGLVDEVRVYNRALSAAEVQQDMQTAVNGAPPPPDTTPPSAPSGLTASTAIGSAALGWTASSDNVGVSRYNVHRSQTAGFTPSVANRIAQPTGTSYTDSGLAAGTYYYRVTAEDAAGNIGSASAQVTAVVPADQSPTVSITAPAGGATVTGAVSVTAGAADDVGVAGVQFRLGAVNLGSEDTSAPYSVSWDTTTVSNGSYSLTAVARDTANHTTTSSAVTVTVSNTAGPPLSVGLVAAYGFDAGSGSSAADSSGKGNVGSITEAAWTPAGRYGSALSFDGGNDWVTVPDSNSLDLTTGMTLEAWVRPSALGGWRTVVFKERAGGQVYAMSADQAGGLPVGQVFIGSERNAIGTSSVPLNAWTHLATTYDGSFLRLYVNGTLATSTAVTGAMAASTGVLRLGGNGVWGEWFAGLIDEVRVYDRALTGSEVQQDMATAVSASPPPPDTQAPSAPAGLTATTSFGSVALSWAASSDNVGVARYNVHRSQTAGFTPAAGNRIAQPTGTSYTDSGLAAGTYYYRVTAEDAAGNVSGASAQLTAAVPADQPPSVSVTAPASGATVSSTISVTASASDDVGVAGVQFRLGAANLGVEDTTAPYSISWDTTTVSNGSYSITAVARDTAAKTTTSAAISVTVSNSPPTAGLVAAYGFNAGSGSTAADSSAAGNTGSVSGALWNAGGRYGSALSFDGVNDWVTTPDANSLDLTNAMTLEAWVRPSALGGWRTVMLKERTGGIVYGLYADQAAGRPLGQVYIGSERNATGTAALPLNTWTHLSTTYDGAVVRLYVNGVLAGSASVSGAMAVSTGVLRIGGNGIWGEWFAGLIDEVRVYNRVLSAAEIQQDMQVPIG